VVAPVGLGAVVVRLPVLIDMFRAGVMLTIEVGCSIPTSDGGVAAATITAR
jgi:hypothetical protein